MFGGEVEDKKTFSVKLNSEKEYREFGKTTGNILYQGSAPYRIENFFKEVSKDLSKHNDSKAIKKIADHFLSLFNEKLRKEKEEDGKKGKKKATLKGAAKGYDRNNNNAMIADVMGAAEKIDTGGADYGDYGDEDVPFTKENEKEVDFM